MGEVCGTICGAFVNIVSTWYRIGVKLAPHDFQIVNLSPNCAELAPNLHHTTPKLLNCHQIGQNGFQVVTATSSFEFVGEIILYLYMLIGPDIFLV